MDAVPKTVWEEHKSMSRYVDVEPLDVVGTKGVSKDYAEGMAYVLRLLDNLPTADVERVRHAEWQLIHRRDKDFYKNVYRCSECRFLVADTLEIAYAYCPNCGARMERKER